MKIVSKITLSIAVATSIFFAGCSNGAVSEESLGLRKTNLYTEDAKTTGDLTRYSNVTAGSSKKIARAFQDAPPMIPHDTTGMLPITIRSNQCVSCHEPAVASSMGATPYPPSHMINFRPSSSYAIAGINTSSESLANISIKKEDKLQGTRFNCTQCHAEQSMATDAPKNLFKADFTSKDGASKSSWSGTKLMEGIDTVK
jgi:cytochrome c-type protein NapB